MNIIQSAPPTLLPGEPTAGALHREEFHNEKRSAQPAKVVDHRARQRVKLLQAAVLTRVGSYFA
jgi:hypothetical protein